MRDYFENTLFQKKNFTTETLLSPNNYPDPKFYRDIQDSITIIGWQISQQASLLSVYQDALSFTRSLYLQFPFSTEDYAVTHQHHHIELEYVISGSLQQTILDQSHTFHDGELILINSDTPHNEVLANEDAEILFLDIKIPYFKTLFYRQSHDQLSDFISILLTDEKHKYDYLHFTPKSLSSNKRVPEIMVQICEEIQRKEDGCEHILSGLMVRLFSYLAKEYTFALSRQSKEMFRRTLYTDICNTIKNDCSSIQIESLQSIYHYHADYFNRIIKEFSGMTFIQLRQEMRLEQAYEQTIHTMINIDDIARNAGYNNLTYFYRTFRQKYGDTPGNIRSRYSS